MARVLNPQAFRTLFEAAERAGPEVFARVGALFSAFDETMLKALRTNPQACQQLLGEEYEEFQENVREAVADNGVVDPLEFVAILRDIDLTPTRVLTDAALEGLQEGVECDECLEQCMECVCSIM